MRKRDWSKLLVLVALLLYAAPAAAERVEYTVQPGDILGTIAEDFGVSVSQLRAWNDLSGDAIYAGQSLVVYPHRGRQGRGTSRWQSHVVGDGEILGVIAERYGVRVAEIVEWNPGLAPDRIRAGQEIRIRRQGRPVRRVVYEVEPGDFLGRIAHRHRVSIDDIVEWNGGMNPDQVRIGQELVLWIEGPEEESESIGRANRGRLVNGELLPAHRGYRIRHENRAWGTNETVSAMIDGFDAVVRRHDDPPRVWVHDLSFEDGGRMRPHVSHQNGRDADIGYYHAGCRSECDYRTFDSDDLDVAKQWTLFSYWIENDLVDYIFVDYRYQRRMYDWLQDQGATERELDDWFQYPHGRRAARGVIRHEPGHDDHFHVRFACDPTDERCR